MEIKDIVEGLRAGCGALGMMMETSRAGKLEQAASLFWLYKKIEAAVEVAAAALAMLTPSTGPSPQLMTSRGCWVRRDTPSASSLMG